MCLGEKEFRVLEGLKDRWLRRVLGAAAIAFRRRGKRRFLDSAPKNDLVKSPTSLDSTPARGQWAGDYQATEISNAYDSVRWSWLRVAEYFGSIREIHGVV